MHFNLLADRNDQGALWENFLIVERLKYRSYHQIYANQYFWRTYQGKEIDLIEEREGKLFGYECKWNSSSKKSKTPAEWLAYPGSFYMVVTPKDLIGLVV